jgi:hypothetical protein
MNTVSSTARSALPARTPQRVPVAERQRLPADAISERGCGSEVEVDDDRLVSHGSDVLADVDGEPRLGDHSP